MLKKQNSKWSSTVEPVKKMFTGQPKDVSPEKLHELIRTRAYEIYRSRGCSGGNPVNDWITAEKQIKSQLKIQ